MDSSKLPAALAKLELSTVNSALLGLLLLAACLLVSHEGGGLHVHETF